jgi:hypothetical protein
MRSKVEGVARELMSGDLRPEPAKAKLLQTRRIVQRDWLETAAALRAQGERTLAHEVEAFVKAMPGVRTEKEQIAAGLLGQIEALHRRQTAGAQAQSSERGGEAD